jgi:hypothetical protein
MRYHQISMLHEQFDSKFSFTMEQKKKILEALKPIYGINPSLNYTIESSSLQSMDFIIYNEKDELFCSFFCTYDNDLNIFYLDLYNMDIAVYPFETYADDIDYCVKVTLDRDLNYKRTELKCSENVPINSEPTLVLTSDSSGITARYILKGVECQPCKLKSTCFMSDDFVKEFGIVVNVFVEKNRVFHIYTIEDIIEGYKDPEIFYNMLKVAEMACI